MKIRKVIGMGCAAVLGLSLLGSGTANATPAISFQNGTTAAIGGYTLGYEFTVLTNISVTHLGYYDLAVRASRSAITSLTTWGCSLPISLPT